MLNKQTQAIGAEGSGIGLTLGLIQDSLYKTVI